MSKADRIQLSFIYGGVVVLAVLTAFVLNGAFGSPKFVKDEQTSPAWLTGYEQPVNLVGSTDQSSEFSGNFVQTANPQQ